MKTNHYNSTQMERCRYVQSTKEVLLLTRRAGTGNMEEMAFESNVEMCLLETAVSEVDA